MCVRGYLDISVCVHECMNFSQPSVIGTARNEYLPRLAFSWLSERDVSGGNDTAEIGATKRRQSAAPELILVDVALVACLVHHLCRPFSAAIY